MRQFCGQKRGNVVGCDGVATDGTEGEGYDGIASCSTEGAEGRGEETACWARRPAWLIWSRFFQREEARVVAK